MIPTATPVRKSKAALGWVTEWVITEGEEQQRWPRRALLGGEF